MAEIIYNGNDNAIDIQLLEDAVAINLSSVTRMIIAFGTKVVDSDTSPDAFDWSEGSGKLTLILGAESIPEGLYDAELTVYNAENINGIVWGTFKTVVK